jgi:hypothetical protein
MASDQLTGNMATEVLLNYLDEQQIAHDVKSEAIPKMMADFQAMLLGND